MNYMVTIVPRMLPYLVLGVKDDVEALKLVRKTIGRTSSYIPYGISKFSEQEDKDLKEKGKYPSFLANKNPRVLRP
jgi:hypothetical protein